MTSSWKMYQNPNAISLSLSFVGYCAGQDDTCRIRDTSLAEVARPSSD